jgi:serine/threonine protein kinase
MIACRFCYCFMTNFKVMLTIIRDYPASTRAIRNAGDYQDIFGPMPEVEREIPSRIQPPRGSTHGTKAGDVVTVYTDLHHMDQLAKTYGPSTRYTGVPIMVEEVFTKDVIKGSMNRWDVSNTVLKYFPDDSATMMTEIRAYEALKPLQGGAVPRFISVFFVGLYRGRAIGLSAVEGITLRQHFKEEAPSIEFFRSVLDQLQAVHDCGVAHMDIRAENIIIKPDRSVVFIDFGNSV